MILRGVVRRPGGMGASVLLILSAHFVTSCVSVPQEAVVLSRVVGVQIAEHRASHEEFVRLYYARSRDVVEIFLQDRWVPEYLNGFVGRSRLMELLVTPDEVFDETTLELLREEILAVSGVGEVRAPQIIAAVSRVVGNAERGQILLDFAEVALAEIQAQRHELLDPLEIQEERTLDYLAESYGQLQQAQNQVTAYLASARDVTRSQDEVLEVMGVREVRDDALKRAVLVSRRLSAAAKAGETAAEALEEMKAILREAGQEGSEG